MIDDRAFVEEILSCRQRHKQIIPFSKRDGGLSLARAYRIGAAVQQQRSRDGERPVGRKIGFTNRTIWGEFNVDAPIFGPMYDSTVRALGPEPFDLSGLLEPKIEPEIAFRLAATPEPGMDAVELMGCVSGICAGFELVQSVFPGWKFEASDTVAAFGLHGAFLHAPILEVRLEDRQDWVRGLSEFRTTLSRNGTVADEGHATNVLGGGPLMALGHLVQLIQTIETAPPLAAGELITTGTLTRALPISAGENWQARFDGLPLEIIQLSLTDASV